MESIDAITLRNRTDRHIAEMLQAHLFRTRGPTQRANCWEIEDKMAMLDTALRGFACGPIYIIQDVDEKIDDVFDGAHRCEAVFDFIDNKYPITKGKKITVNWASSPLKDHIGKFFKDLPPTIQLQLKQYKFYINIIDQETANDPASRGILWQRLSKAGKPLNNFETKTQTHGLLYQNILKPNVGNWLTTALFQKDKSTRGQVETLLLKLLALSEKETLYSFNSIEDLTDKWCDDVLGLTTDDINRNTAEKTEMLSNRIKHIRSIMKELQDKKILHTADGVSFSIDKSNELPLLLSLGRLGYWFRSVSQLKRVLDEVCDAVSEILKMTPTQRCEYLGVTSRNAGYQKKLIEELDRRFKPLAEKSNERRCFTAAEKKRKLEEQGGLCTECKEPIEEYQRTAGDHIYEYCRGGTTTYENLQILHKLCHEKKNMG